MIPAIKPDGWNMRQVQKRFVDRHIERRRMGDRVVINGQCLEQPIFHFELNRSTDNVHPKSCRRFLGLPLIPVWR